MFLKPYQQKPYIFKQTELFEVKDVYFLGIYEIKSFKCKQPEKLILSCSFRSL